MKIVSYNINGIRASYRLGVEPWLVSTDADVYCFQEVRFDDVHTRELIHGSAQTTMDSKPYPLNSYYITTNCGSIKGYSGTMMLSKEEPDRVIIGMGEYWDDEEGRTLTLVFGKLAIVNAYIPNGNSRLEFKLKYLNALTNFVNYLREKYSVILVGDFNIAHNEIDLNRPKECSNKSVFLPIERKEIDKLIGSGLIDTFRHLNPSEVKYTWRSYRTQKDDNFNGYKYRIDYIFASQDLKERLASCNIYDLPYSDHLPVILELRDKK